MFKLFEDLVENTFKTVDSFIDDPVGTTVYSVTSPVRNTLDLIDGLSEGELRLKAAVSLGLDVAAGLGTSELISWYKSTL
jgi:hypothetical protein